MEDLTRVNTRWSNEEEKLLAEIWVEISQDKDIGNDRSDDFFWNQILKMFNSQSGLDNRTKHMLTGKWTRVNGNCQKINAIYKHLQCRSGENDIDHIENAKTNFQQRFARKNFIYVQVWDILKKYPKWDAEDPIEISCLEDLFGPDKRPRPDGAYKSRASKKSKSTDTSSAGGSQTSSFSGHLSDTYSRKAEIQMAAYEARRQKEMGYFEMEELKFLIIDPDQTTPAKAALIRRKQEQIMKKHNLNEENA